MPRLCGQQVAAEGERIPSGRMRQLVDEALDVEAGDAVADRAPEADGYADVLHHVLDAAVGRGVGRLDRPLDRGRIDAVLRELREHRSEERRVGKKLSVRVALVGRRFSKKKKKT